LSFFWFCVVVNVIVIFSVWITWSSPFSMLNLSKLGEEKIDSMFSIISS